MSRELARDFFERDLTPAEADALEADLEASSETAEALLAAAEAHYRATGLPEPRWSARRPARWRKGWYLLLALLGGSVLFAFSRGREGARVLAMSEAEGDLRVVEAAWADESQLGSEEGGDRPRPALSAGRREATPRRQGRLLGVVLRLKAPIRLAVDVFDGQGRICRRLYAGEVSAGEQRFEWDGLDDGGRRLPAGAYEVRISGPGIELARSLNLRAQAD